MQVAYVPVGVPTFELNCAKDQFDKSVQLLKSLKVEVKCPKTSLLSLVDLTTFLNSINPDLIVFQNNTFANGAYMQKVVTKFKNVPLLLWTLAEPIIDGGRLRLNSLTGAYSAGNVMHNLGKPKYEYMFGAP